MASQSEENGQVDGLTPFRFSCEGQEEEPQRDKEEVEEAPAEQVPALLKFPDEARIVSLEATMVKLQRAFEPLQGAFFLSVGMLTCFYGQHFPYSVLFWRAFANIGLPVARSATSEFKERYLAVHSVAVREMEHMPKVEEAMEAAQHAATRLQALQEKFHAVQETGDEKKVQELAAEIEALQADIAPIQEAGTSLLKVSQELQPSRLKEVAQGLYQAVVLSLKTALTDGASCVGLPFGVGDFVAKRVNTFAEPGLRSLVGFVSARGGPAMQQLQADENARVWIDRGINGICRSMGIGAAFIVERRLFCLANARLGGMMMARGAESIMGYEPGAAGLQSALFGYIFFGAGVFSQVILSQNVGDLGFMGAAIGWCAAPPKMGPMKMLVSLPLAAETWLQAFVAAMRAFA